MGGTANRLTAIAVVGQQFRFIPHANLPHFDACLKLFGQISDQLAKINTSFGQKVDDDSFAAENSLDIDQLHLQLQRVDASLTDCQVSRVVPGQMPPLMPRSSSLTKRTIRPSVGSGSVVDGSRRRFAQYRTDLRSAVGSRDHFVAVAKRIA